MVCRLVLCCKSQDFRSFSVCSFLNLSSFLTNRTAQEINLQYSYWNLPLKRPSANPEHFFFFFLQIRKLRSKTTCLTSHIELKTDGIWHAFVSNSTSTHTALVKIVGTLCRETLRAQLISVFSCAWFWICASPLGKCRILGLYKAHHS